MRRNIWRIRLEAQLATLPLLANCDRRALRRIAQWADVVEVDRGEVLVRENHGDFWFFVVLQGEVRFTRKKSQIATVGPGSYFGENAIVGLRPQQATATTTESSTLLVIGARYFLSLLATSPAFQRALFPDVDPANYTVYAKQMRAKGAAEWRQLPPLKRSIPKPAGLSAPLGAPNGVGSKELAGRDRAPGRPLSRREAISLLASMPAQTQVAPPPPPKPLPKWVWAVAGGIATATVSLVLFAYHPPRAVIAAGRPIDVVHDIQIRGVPTHQPRGRYLLLWVRVSRPNLAGYLGAVVHGRTTVPVPPDHPTRADQAAAEKLGRQQYLDSQRTAITRAEAAAGVDPKRVTIVIRDRGFTGPSAGLVYSLAVTDMLKGTDVLKGRAVAATGGIEGDGTIDDVGWVAVKAGGAVSAGAQVLLVPATQQSIAYHTTPAAAVYGVKSLSEALEVLQR